MRRDARGLIRICCGLLPLLWWPILSWAHTSEEFTALSVTNYTGYVIDSDGANDLPEYNRDAIIAEAEVVYSTTSDTPTEYEYRLDFSLLDSQDNPVALWNENEEEDTIYSVFEPNVTLPQTIFNITLKTSTRHYSAPLRPAIRLDPEETYRVRVELYQRQPLVINPNTADSEAGGGAVGSLIPIFQYSPTGDVRTGSARRYIHFTNLVSDDPALNVMAEIDSDHWTRRYLVETVPGRETMRAEVDFTLRRWDGFNAFPSTDNVTVHLDFELREAGTDAPVAVIGGLTNVVKSIASHGITLIGNPIPPAEESFSQTLAIRPASPIDPRNQYYLAVTIRHEEEPGEPAVSGNTLPTANARLLHFTGLLLFGDIQTRLTSINNNPSAISILTDGVSSTLAVSADGGFIVGNNSHTFGDGSALPVLLRPDGVAEYTGAGNVTVNAPAPDLATTERVRFKRQNLVLHDGGATADLVVYLPAGLGHGNNTESRIVKGTFQWSAQALTQSLVPLKDELTLLTLAGSPFYLCEETKPFWIECSSVRWRTQEGRFLFFPTSTAPIYVRGKELDELETAAVQNPSARKKRSNEQYFRYLEKVVSSPVEVVAGANTEALLNVDLTFTPGRFSTHFPYDSEVSWNGAATMTVEEDLITGPGSVMDQADPVEVRYTRDCSAPDCGPGMGPESFALKPDATNLTFTRDGGLASAGQVANPKDLNWGWINEPSIQRYAQSVEAFAEAAFHMPGFFLRGDQSPVSQLLQRPAVILFSGVDAVDRTSMERPGTPAYAAGLGDYGGLNFRVGADGAKQAESVLAGEPTGNYPLEGRSKYYVRPGGVNGIHEAVFGAFPESATLYGYEFKFSNYGLSYLDSQNVDSRTEGSVHIEFPSDFDQNFESLKFSCLGALEDAQVPSGEAGLMKILAFWQADFSVLAIRFDRKEGAQCDPGEGYLTLGVEAYAQHVDAVLYGTLGFRSNGNLITLDDNLLDPPFDSRLKLPNQFFLEGPGDEEYAFTPVNDAYYNNWEFYQTDPGFINIAGKMDVPFFEDLKVHMHTSADRDGTTAPIYLMGGWPGKGFELSPGHNFFTENPSDRDNRGFPTDTTVDGYHQGNTDGNAKYLVRAQRNWLGVVDLDYPLDWSTTTRAFTSFEPVHNDLLVLNVEHQAKYISPQNVELAFGAQYDGIPQLNLANLAFDELTGAAQAVENALGAAAREAIDTGLGRMDTMLSDQLHQLFDQAFDDLIDPVIDRLYDDLEGAYNAVDHEFPVGEPATTINNVIFGPGNSMVNRLNNIIDGAGAAQVDLIHQVDSNLAEIQEAIDQIRNILAEAPDGSREIVANLVKELVGELAAQFLGSIVDSQLQALIQEIDPTLDQIDGVLVDLSEAVQGVRDQLEAGQEFADQLKDALANQAAQINTVLNQLQADVIGIFNAMDLSIDDPFVHYSEAELKALVRQKLEDRFFGSPIAASIQEIIKQRLYDLDAAIREGIDSLFQQVNTIIRDLINESLAEVDNSINGFLGDVNSVMGAGKINGYAHINGDSLKLLRLDIYAQMQVPSEMEFNAFLQIKELDSEGSPTECLPASGKATEVTVGATDVEVDWISPDLRASVEGKFTFDSGVSPPLLQTLGAGFELTGELSFETFKIKYLGASMAFGALENYFSCAARVQINQYEGMGGLMFGKACSLAPFFWDPDVADILGDPPFTGAYVYGEVWIPISEALLGIPATCLFQVSAGAGAGAGYFVEGPTFVGKMLLGASGDLLCIVSVKGEIKLVGVKNNDGLNLKGSGRLKGEIGFCPFCVSFGKTVDMTYKNNSWDVDL